MDNKKSNRLGKQLDKLMLKQQAIQDQWDSANRDALKGSKKAIIYNFVILFEYLAAIVVLLIFSHGWQYWAGWFTVTALYWIGWFTVKKMIKNTLKLTDGYLEKANNTLEDYKMVFKDYRLQYAEELKRAKEERDEERELEW